ncbi:hypothetical protein [Paenibacillus sp. FSL K6-2859]|uniref:hypothetical protein n=1 Tax=Paenibacillus sp. FSL K6-2859 TaxID=2921482 RepID=UPI0030F7A5E2
MSKTRKINISSISLINLTRSLIQTHEFGNLALKPEDQKAFAEIFESLNKSEKMEFVRGITPEQRTRFLKYMESNFK